MTILELLLVVACLLVLATVLLPILAAAKRRQSKISCASNLKQINLAFRIWEEDNGGRFPMSVSVTNGGAMELIDAGSLTPCLQCVSNEMSTTKILVCPDDPARAFATNWDDLNNSHVSYFLSADASNDADPNVLLNGDDNFELNGSPVKSGLFNLSSNTLVAWAPGRHSESYRPHSWWFPERFNYGNIGFADGHVEPLGPVSLRDMLQHICPTTNRIAIP